MKQLFAIHWLLGNVVSTLSCMCLKPGAAGYLLGPSPCSCPVFLDILSLFQNTAKSFGITHHSAGCKKDTPGCSGPRRSCCVNCIQDDRPYQGYPNASWASMMKLESVCIVLVMEEVSDSITFSVLCVDIYRQ